MKIIIERETNIVFDAVDDSVDVTISQHGYQTNPDAPLLAYINTATHDIITKVPPPPVFCPRALTFELPHGWTVIDEAAVSTVRTRYIAERATALDAKVDELRTRFIAPYTSKQVAYARKSAAAQEVLNGTEPNHPLLVPLVGVQVDDSRDNAVCETVLDVAQVIRRKATETDAHDGHIDAIVIGAKARMRAAADQETIDYEFALAIEELNAYVAGMPTV